MPESPANIDLDEKEFLCFLMIYASHVDYEFSQFEEKHILSHFDDDIFDRMKSLFFDQTDYDSLQLILAHREKYFNSNAQLDHIREMLHDLFNSDGEYSRIEKNFIPFFLKMIDINKYESGN